MGKKQNDRKGISILINARVLSERMGGPARYLKNIIFQLSRIDMVNTYFILVKNEGYEFDFKLPDNFNKVTLKSNNRVVIDYWLIPLFSWKQRIDLSFFPKNTFSPLVRGKKIPVYHDIIYFERGLGFREFKFFDNLHHRFMIPLAAKFSTYDMTVSEFTASRMRILLGINGDKVRIIKEGVEDRFHVIDDIIKLNSVKERLGLKTPFFFYSGSLSPRKNIAAVIRAFHEVKTEIQHNLYITGPDSWNNSERQIIGLIDELNLNERIKVLGFLNDDDLVAMYNLAECYMYPSLYEGFGLPILEAQACGCPVITSHVASCPEVAGDSALLVDPRDINDIAGAMLRVAKDKRLRNSLVTKGYDNIQRFSWEKAAKEIYELFCECGRNQ